MTKDQLASLKTTLAEHKKDIATLGLTDCQLLWSLKNGEGKIAAYSVLVLVPEREDQTTQAVCEKHERRIRYQIAQEVEQHAGQSNEYYTYLQDLELDLEKLSEKVVEQRMEELYATFVRDRDAPLPESPLRLCPKVAKDDQPVSHEFS